MRHAIGFADLRGRRVGVLGLGIEGRAALARLRELDVDAVVVDDAPEGVGEPGVLGTTSGGLEALRRCEVVIKTPGISRHRADVRSLEAAGIAVVGGLGLWLEDVDRRDVVAVTGTKGKSTVTTVVGHLAAALGRPSVVVGNLGTPPFAPGLELDGKLVVAEVSSFQATDVAHSPPIVAVTSLGEDHLDWHGDAPTYHRDKLSLTSQPGAATTVAARSATLEASAELLGGDVQWVTEADDELAHALGLAGPHGAMNAAVALAVLRTAAVEVGDRDALLDAARSYRPLPGRFCEIADFGGWRFIDDSLATNPLPTLAALDAVGEDPLAILVGGHDRGVDYAPLAHRLAGRAAPTTVVTLPENGPRIGAMVAARGGAALDAADMDEAVRLATEVLPRGGTVLLSPAAPSFSQFRDWAARSAAFLAAVDRLRPGGPPV